MKLSEFIVLNEVDKKSAVLHQGILIAKRNSSEHMIFLFQLNGFYVETFCRIRNRAVEEYRASENTGMLLPYLEKIPIDSLFSGPFTGN